MSLIHTCELSGANPFDYLTELQRHADELAAQPAELDALELPGNARGHPSRTDGHAEKITLRRLAERNTLSCYLFR